MLDGFGLFVFSQSTLPQTFVVNQPDESFSPFTDVTAVAATAFWIEQFVYTNIRRKELVSKVNRVYCTVYVCSVYETDCM